MVTNDDIGETITHGDITIGHDDLKTVMEWLQIITAFIKNI
jgi:hypothetical protein